MTKAPRKKTSNVDVVIIGSGAAGSIAAHTLAQAGKRVVIVEEAHLGGDSANYGDVPTKALLEFAHVRSLVNESSRYGIAATHEPIDIQAVKHWRAQSIAKTGVTHNKTAYTNQAIRVLRGHAHFTNPYALTVGLSQLSAKYFIIATGTAIAIPNIEGLKETPYITYRSFDTLDRVPDSVAIIGSDSIAFEYAQIFEALGSRVSLFDPHAHLLSDYDSEVSDLAASVLTRRGVAVRTGSSVTRVHKSGKGIVIDYKHDSQHHHAIVDTLFVAGDRTASLDVGLDNANILYSKDGIATTRLLQTSQKHIFAIGGVAARPRSTASAIRQGQIAAHNILHRRKVRFSPRSTPDVIFGSPSIATIGVTERDIRLTGVAYQTSIAPIALVSRSFSSAYDSGFVKIIAAHNGTVIGASIVAPHASELIHELAVAVEQQLKACDIANTLHVFSSWSEATRVAASKIYCT